MRRLKSILLSRKTTTLLIGLMLLSGVAHSFLIGGGAKLPPSIVMIARLNQTVLSIISLLVICSLFLSIDIMLRKWRKPAAITADSGVLTEIRPEVIVTAEAGVVRFMRGSGYRLLEREGGRYVFQKHGIGRLGIVLFHVGLLVVVAAFLYRGIFGMRGVINLIPGDRIMVTDGDWNTKDMGLVAGRFDTDFVFGFSRIEPVFLGGKLHDLKSTVSLESGGAAPQERTISFQFPISIGGVSIYQTDSQGPVVTVSLARNGRSETTHFLMQSPHGVGNATGDGDFPGTPYYFTLSLPTKDAAAPYVRISTGKTILFEGTMKPRDKVMLGADAFCVTDITRWSGFMFTAKQGTYGFYGGVVVVIAGIVLYYMLFPRQVAVVFRTAGEMTAVSVGFVSMTAAPFPRDEREKVLAGIEAVARGAET